MCQGEGEGVAQVPPPLASSLPSFPPPSPEHDFPRQATARLILQSSFLGLVNDLIAAKTAKGEYSLHPDMPDRIDARMYLVYMNTEWNQDSAKETERTIEGSASGLTAQQGHALALGFAETKIGGPQAFLKAPSLQFSLTGAAASAVGAIGKEVKNGKNGKSGTPIIPKNKDAAPVGPAKAKAKADGGLASSFKLLTKVLGEISSCQTGDARLQTLSGGGPFAKMMSEHVISLTQRYELLRVELQIIPPNMEHAGDKSTALRQP